jgi:hypothetical protein
MSLMRTLILAFAVTTFLAALAACGKGTDSGKVFVPEQGHSDQWASHLSVGTAGFHGTYIKTVPPASSGATVFVMHCAPCHNNDASGKVGPDIRQLGLSFPIVNAAIQNLPIMHGHRNLTAAEVQSVVDYIATLPTTQPLAGSFDAALCTECHGAGLDGGTARVSCFSCHNGPDGSVGHPAGWLDGKGSPETYHGRYGRELVSGCTTCHGTTLAGSIVLLSATGVSPACASCHNGTIAPVL